jgi:hypothetical protein
MTAGSPRAAGEYLMHADLEVARDRVAAPGMSLPGATPEVA